LNALGLKKVQQIKNIKTMKVIFKSLAVYWSTFVLLFVELISIIISK